MPTTEPEPISSDTAGRITLFMTGLAGGGAERVMLTLAEAFADKGYDVDLVVTNAQGPLAADVPETVRLVDLGARRIIASLPAFVRYLRRQRPTVILSALAPANCVAVWALQLSRVCARLVLSEHSTLSVAAGSAVTRRGRLLPALMRRAYPTADAVVAVSGGVADDLVRTIGLSRERIEVIYNPVVTSRMLELSREPVDHPWFAGDQPPVVLSVGRLTAAKDYPTLLRAFALIRQERSAHLMILGEGEERSALKALAQELGISDKLAMPGFVNNPYSYMRAASVFVLSSSWEGLPTVLIEAMACSTPVVSTDCPSGPAEILNAGHRGELVPVGDVTALTDAMERILSVRSGISEHSMETMLSEFGPNMAINKYFSLLLDKERLGN